MTSIPKNIGEMIFLAQIMGLTSGLLHILLASGNLTLNSCSSKNQFSKTTSGAKFAAKIPTLLPLAHYSKRNKYPCTSNGKILLYSLLSKPMFCTSYFSYIANALNLHITQQCTHTFWGWCPSQKSAHSSKTRHSTYPRTSWNFQSIRSPYHLC